MTRQVDQIEDREIRAFRRRVLSYYKKHGRDLPFRRTTDSYCIAVAELMLQQTQAERVVAKYESWIERWPDWQSLAEASTRDLLAAWSGLGYNRRALFLGRMAAQVVREYDGALPDDPEEMKKLPGIGEYTANAIAIFAFNKPLITIDTNIRKVYLLEFDLPDDLPRAEIERVAWRALPKSRACDWHNALMDYGRGALRTPERKVAPLTKQSRFVGSRRQIRGEIVRQLTNRRRVSIMGVAETLGRSVDDVREAAKTLADEHLVVVTAKTVRLRE